MLDVSPEVAQQFEGGGWQQVPPPNAAPIDKAAESLGLCRGLRAEKDHGQFRCCNCSHMQPRGSWLVWVPDGVSAGDPDWSVTENARCSAYNGTGGGWCLRCAKRLGKGGAVAALIHGGASGDGAGLVAPVIFTLIAAALLFLLVK